VKEEGPSNQEKPSSADFIKKTQRLGGDLKVGGKRGVDYGGVAVRTQKARGGKPILAQSYYLLEMHKKYKKGA